MNLAAALLERLAARRSIAEKLVIVAAHPDDETIGIGAQLGRLQDVLLVHVTDGAPRDGHDAALYGFASRATYAAARRAELGAALVAGEASHVMTLCLNITDREASHHLIALTHRLHEIFEQTRPKAVITHAYEGGHPDHDAAAFAVRAACRLMTHPSEILEMALYHRRNDRLVSGEFLKPARRRNSGRTNPPVETLTSGSRVSPGQAVRCAALELDETEVQRKQRMIDCFTTQRWLLMQLDWRVERLRAAPDYDFRAAPHSGKLHYEMLGWGVTGADWHRRAVTALAKLGLH